MRVLQIGRYPEVTMLDAPVPYPGPGQVVMKVLGVATCPQWDLHLRHDEPMFAGHAFAYPYTPGQPGHEATGVIAAVGDGVADLEVGDRVSAWRDAGHDRWGCYAEYVLMDAGNVIAVPESLPVEATASVELAMCVGATFLLLRTMGGLQGVRVGINGLGPAGLVAAQMARAEGASRVMGFDPSATRRKFAAGWCVDEAHDPTADLGNRVPPRQYGAAVDVIVDCVGAKRAVGWAMDHAGSRVALFGVQREDYTYTPRHYGGLSLIGYPGHSREAADYAVGLIASGKLDLAPLITHTMPLSDYQRGIDLLERQEAIKVLFVP
jgi:threonine dehydrogenase-like Zn-dependent dehydrogenase